MQFRFTRLVVLVVGMSLAASACGRYSISSIRSAKAFQDGIGLYKSGDYVPAAEHFTEAIRLNPDFPFSYFFLGNSYDNCTGRPARARRRTTPTSRRPSRTTGSPSST